MAFIGLGVPEIILIGLVGVVPFALMLYCLVEITQSRFRDNTTKLLWALIVLFAPFLGSLIYLWIGRNQRIASRNV